MASSLQVLRQLCILLIFLLELICEVYVQNLYTFLISLKRAAGLVHFFLANLNTLTLCLPWLFQAT